ncbi:RNA-binding protein [Candidatus Pacearchaeota archaeon]|nr:RNA-binding protein [Candidatus Pacearchaeota archaeon]|tara:strand:- start:588 stop:1403 length:816 start_codon:yes stop_codon:yes gene_type:complete
MSSMPVSNLTKEKLRKMLEEKKRFDSRDLLDLRDLTIEYEVSNKAEGSARVKLGKTEVIVGVKLGVGEPYPDALDKGTLMVSGDLLPSASPRFETGPPGFEAIELPRLIDRAIRAAEIIDFSTLVIEPGKKVWTVFIDIYPINDDGNLIDAASIAAIAALHKTKVPELDKNGFVDYDKKPTNPLKMNLSVLPISFSFFKLGNSLFLDPTREEEEAADSRTTFGISKEGSKYFLNSCQKIGETPLTQKEVESIMSIIPKKFDELSEKLNKYL